MKNKSAVVIINNYNYGNYLGACVRAALEQTYFVKKVIVIDDGSSDDSLCVLESILDKRLQIESKKNAGQLSCLNFATKYIDKNDIIFFLDSDDLLPPDYIEKVIPKFDDGCDILFAETVKFGPSNLPLSSCVISSEPDVNIFCSAFLTLQTRCWIGSPTSSISLTGNAYNQIFPYPDEERWRTRADDVVVFGSSILGMYKKYSPSIGVAYRIHENNNFHGKMVSASDIIKRNFALEKLFGEMAKRAGLSRLNYPSGAYLEALQIPIHLHSRFFIPNLSMLKIQKYSSRLSRWLFGK